MVPVRVFIDELLSAEVTTAGTAAVGSVSPKRSLIMKCSEGDGK